MSEMILVVKMIMIMKEKSDNVNSKTTQENNNHELIIPNGIHPIDNNKRKVIDDQ